MPTCSKTIFCQISYTPNTICLQYFPHISIPPRNKVVANRSQFTVIDFTLSLLLFSPPINSEILELTHEIFLSFPETTMVVLTDLIFFMQEQNGKYTFFSQDNKVWSKTDKDRTCNRLKQRATYQSLWKSCMCNFMVELEWQSVIEILQIKLFSFCISFIMCNNLVVLEPLDLIHTFNEL